MRDHAWRRPAAEPARLIFLWCQQTWQQPFETGVQRVVRRLGRGLAESGVKVVPIGWDSRTRLVVRLDSRAIAFEQALSRCMHRECAAPWLLVPEISSDLAATDLDPIQLGRAYGLKTAALVHDLIPLKLSQNYDESALAWFRRYVAMFASPDIVFTTTNYVANDLRAYLAQSGLTPPETVTVPLPAQFADQKRVTSIKPVHQRSNPLRLVTVSTWEPRKNLPRLLRAIRQAETRATSSIELALVGRRGIFSALDAEVQEIIAGMPRVKVYGSISDDDLVALHAGSHASVYPSIEEGFGLPIGESLWLATPCVCHSGSSMAEIAPGGGTLMVDMTDEAAIAGALLDLLDKPDLLASLAAETVDRPLASWQDYALEVASKLP